jgi:hypothetical protein
MSAPLARRKPDPARLKAVVKQQGEDLVRFKKSDLSPQIVTAADIEIHGDHLAFTANYLTCSCSKL